MSLPKVEMCVHFRDIAVMERQRATTPHPSHRVEVGDVGGKLIDDL